MDVRPLGRTGMLVSSIGLGTVKVGRNRGVKYPGGEGAPLPSDEAVAELFGAASELGVSLIDTAPAYGVSEERIGTIMRSHGWFGGRERWVVTTKAGEAFDAVSARSAFDFSAEAVRASVERSLRRLGVDALDVVLLHSDGQSEGSLVVGEGMAALRELKREGSIRAIGVSVKTVEGGLAAVDPARGACDVVMVTYNSREQEGLRVIEAAERAGVGVLVKKALESGRAAGAGTSGTGLAIRWALSPAGVSSVVVGTAKAAHLKENAREAGLIEPPMPGRAGQSTPEGR